MSQYFTFFFVILIAGVTRSQEPVKTESKVPVLITLNQVLFTESNQSWTSRDLKLYEKLMNVVAKKNLSPWSEGRNEDFLLSRLSYREAALFGVTPEKAKISEADRKKIATTAGNYSPKEIDDELARVSYALMFVDLKENQLKQKERFTTWFTHLKRKYQVKIKAAESGVAEPAQSNL